MAKKTGYNPLALSAEGREGSGAAQIFQPYDAGKYERAKAEQTQAKAAKSQEKKSKFNYPDYDFENPVTSSVSAYQEDYFKLYDKLEAEYVDALGQIDPNNTEEQNRELELRANRIGMDAAKLNATIGTVDEVRDRMDAISAIIDKDGGKTIDLDKTYENFNSRFKYEVVSDNPSDNIVYNRKKMLSSDPIVVYKAEAFPFDKFGQFVDKRVETMSTKGGWTTIDDIPDGAGYITNTTSTKYYSDEPIENAIYEAVITSEGVGAPFAGAVPHFVKKLESAGVKLPEGFDDFSLEEKGKWLSTQAELKKQYIKDDEIISVKRKTQDSGGGADWKKNITSEVASDDSKETIMVEGFVAAEGDVDAFKKKLSKTWVGAKFVDTEKYDNVPSYGILKFGENPRLTTQIISDKVTVITVTGDIGQADISSKALSNSKVLNTSVIWRYKDNNEIVSQDEIKNRDEGNGNGRDAYYEINVIAQGNADEQGTTKVTFMTPLESSTLLTNEQKEFAKEFYSDEAIKEKFGYMYDDILP